MNVGSRFEQVDYASHADHSSALQLLSLGKMSNSPPPIMHHESPTTTHGRNRKKRRMQQAEAAAQIMESSSFSEPQSNGHAASAAPLESPTIPNGDAKETEASSPTPEASSPTIKQEAFDPEGQDKRNGDNHISTASATPEEGDSPLDHSKLGQKRRARQSLLPMHQQLKSEETSHESNTVTQAPKSPSRSKKKSKKGKGSKSKASSHTGPIEYADGVTELDILMGNGNFNTHPGNSAYRHTVRTYQEQLGTQGMSRVDIARACVDEIYASGARFLKFVGDQWTIMPDEDVMTKVNKALIELRTPAKIKPRKVFLESASVPENPEETSGRRPRRKAASGQKSQDATKQMELPPQSSSGKHRKAKVSRSQESNGATLTTTRRQRIEAIEPTYEEYTYTPDPNKYYVEETAHIYHNPPFPSKYTNGVAIQDLRPVPPPQPLPPLPQNGTCNWSYDETSRVLIADFSANSGNEPLLTLEDSRFLFEMQERTDITVISRGLLNMSKIDPSMWNLDYLRKVVGQEFYHKFRRFDKTVGDNGLEKHLEKDVLLSMRFGDYVDYCEKRKAFLENRSIEQDEPTFDFEDHLGNTHSLGVATSALYMIDVDIKRLTPLLHANFLDSFELPAVLPGGSHCMMNSVTPDARPFMGPNLYVTPPASFTHFHQDGHGTVDSGHLCISGFNEVVMLRRLTERHKKHALWILSGKKEGGHHFDGLYSMPHGDGLGEKPSWPNMDMIDECKKMGYCPSVFTLEPGDLVHINKGRLHAFRKMSTSQLAESDCHAGIRQKVIASQDIAGQEKLCVSVAWDWMYRGVTPEGINREISTVLEASALNRKNGLTSLAIPELSLLQMAKCVPAKSMTSAKGISFLGALEKKKKKPSVYDSTKEEICKGIYPALCVVVGQHVRAVNVKESTSMERGERLSVAKIPDTQENPQICPLDPYGNSDFQCKVCRKELSNIYFHCDGCEKLLSKDFNICRGCYLQDKFAVTVQMHPSNAKRHATLNHTGDLRFNRQSRCVCKNGPQCKDCGFCLGCSCRCHTYFTVRTRLCSAADEEKLLQTVKDVGAIESATAAKGATGKIDTTDEPSKYLCDRLKNAGDQELLNGEIEKEANANEEKKEETKPIQENGQSSPNDSKKADVAQNENNNKEPLNEQMMEETKPSEELPKEMEGAKPSEEPPTIGIKIEQVSEDETGNPQDNVTENEAHDEPFAKKIKKEDVMEEEIVLNGDRVENRPSNESGNEELIF